MMNDSESLFPVFETNLKLIVKLQFVVLQSTVASSRTTAWKSNSQLGASFKTSYKRR